MSGADVKGRYGPYGGRYVPETLIAALVELETQAMRLLADQTFRTELKSELRDFVGRPTPLTLARRLSAAWEAQVFLKREDLCHTGAHKINNAIGQALLARHMGAERVVAETGAGQHGVAAAAACARVGLPCAVYMGAVDIARQASNVQRMRMFGVEVIPVTWGDATLRAAINEAMRSWVADPTATYYMLGSVVGPHPYPWLVRELQSVIGTESRAQPVGAGAGLPDAVVACVGGGSNAIGIFSGFIDDVNVALIGVEAAGNGKALHSATLSYGRPGVLHGAMMPLLQTDDGQVLESHSIAPGLDYPGVGPEHGHLRDLGRASYVTATDDEALAALAECSRLEGILPALESSHALAGARRWALNHPGSSLVVCISGRGDKDLGVLDD